MKSILTLVILLSAFSTHSLAYDEVYCTCDVEELDNAHEIDFYGGEYMGYKRLYVNDEEVEAFWIASQRKSPGAWRTYSLAEQACEESVQENKCYDWYQRWGGN
ncbi:MAG: hypothetical protein KDD25_03230 [Bdellovibrionales bacterium]|nr:hypothetical protein [Bdellovibrionales bacterium]